MRLKPNETLAEASFSMSWSAADKRWTRLNTARDTVVAEAILKSLSLISHSIPSERELLKIMPYMNPTR
jgi:hypothetical protein